MGELAGEGLLVGRGDPNDVGSTVSLAPAIDGRMLLEPGGRKGQRSDRVGEEEGDRLSVLERVEELDPGAVPASAVGQPDRSRHGSALVPPVAGYDLGRERLSHLFEQPVDDVQVVHETPEVALGERPDGIGVAGAHGRLDLLGFGPPSRLHDLGRDVVAADDLPIDEVGVELGIVHHDTHVAKLLC